MELNFIIGIGASVVTIIAAISSGIRHLGRAGAVGWVADRLGVDLASMVIPEPGEDTGSPHTEEGNRRVNFLLEHFYPPEFEEALRRWANEPGDGYDTTDLVHLACGEVAPGAVIEIALDGEGQNLRTRILGQHLTDAELGSLLDDRELWPNPIHQVAQLEDDPGNAYAWILSEEATEEDRASLRSEIESTFIEMQHSEPDSLHFIVGNIDGIQELDAETVERYVKPWLKEQNDSEEENK
jgi:hypothetical protein